eukprot:TRINITY_DN1543_c0_g1_i1.p1 TRINITY_DN1543_c0_g1~~TRINITY_DN1543_c0_g1_i1.p1  ORF type:complete len:516 (+),score=136.53 TRINITY_DN1543_c0_g1_i1:1328-2875(+)
MVRLSTLFISVLVVSSIFSIVYYELQLAPYKSPTQDPPKYRQDLEPPIKTRLNHQVKTSTTKIEQGSKEIQITQDQPILTEDVEETPDKKEEKKKWKKSTDEKPQPSCKHNINRDYTKQPIIYRSGSMEKHECDIPCVWEGDDPDVGGASSDPHNKRVSMTMENYGTVAHGDSKTINGNTNLLSDVPLQYFSWAEYPFMDPPHAKTASSMVLAMISNCGPQHRLQYLKQLEANGVTVDHFGGCFPDKLSEPPNLPGGHRLDRKFAIMLKYKFVFSFENSNTDDYITEKMFGPLAAGSVPIYSGAPNGKKFAPNNRSVLFESDFSGAEQMAEFIKYLDKNESAYNQFLSWKYDGPTQDFISLVDLGIVHSWCRTCIRAADLDRKDFGEPIPGPFREQNEKEMKSFENADALMLKVRERGKFWLRRLHLEYGTIRELKFKLKEKFILAEPQVDYGQVYRIYKIWDLEKKSIETDADVMALEYGDELEVIWTRPSWDQRHSYTEWYQKKQGNVKQKQT